MSERRPSDAATESTPRFSSFTRRAICVVAAMGFAFDSYELLMLPLMIRPALMELGGLRPGSPEFASWASLIFYVPALTGGAFGLLGGYLTDRLGRRRMLTWSILAYAGGAFVSGFSTSLQMLLACRCLVFAAVSVEFVAAIAWLAETFPDQRGRERVLAGTQVFSSVGGILVSLAAGIFAAWTVGRPAQLFAGLVLPALPLPPIAWPFGVSVFGTIANPHADWRYLAMSGLLPAIPLAVIRPFLPESPTWRRKRDEGTLERPSVVALFSPALRRTTIVATIMVTCSFGASFGAIQQMPQIVPGLPDVQAAVANAPGRMASSIVQSHASRASSFQEVGGLAGRMALALVVALVASRRRQLRIFLIPGILVMPLAFGWAGVTNIGALDVGMAAAGFLTVAQFSFWGNYLPHAYPLHLRGTGESFAANIGGRMIGTCFAALTQWIAYALPGGASHPTRLAYVAAGVACTAYAVNLVASFWLPEPPAQGL